MGNSLRFQTINQRRAHPSKEIQNSNLKATSRTVHGCRQRQERKSEPATEEEKRKKEMGDRDSLARLVFAPWKWGTTRNLAPATEQTGEGWFLIEGPALTMMLADH